MHYNLIHFASHVGHYLLSMIRHKKHGKIVLVGAMGSGKTTIAKLLASELDWKSLDSDAQIEADADMSINNIFVQYGESRFRELEEQVILQLLESAGNLVLATGGGAVISRKTRAALLRSAGVIYLKASVATLVSRLSQDDTRPLLKGDNKEQLIRDKLKERAHIYSEVADHIVEVDDKQPFEIVQEIVTHYISN